MSACDPRSWRIYSHFGPATADRGSQGSEINDGTTEIHGKENPNQLPLSGSFPGATPARRVGSFRGYAFVMIFLAGVIYTPPNP